MNMKAIMFAGSGLFLSMVATTMWISADIADIKARELAKRQAECAQLGTSASQAGTPGANGAATGGEIDPVTGQPLEAIPQATNDCATTTAGASTGGGDVDPVTGQPLESSSTLGSGSVAVDPVTGEPIASEGGFDEGTGSDAGFEEAAPSGDPGFETGVVPADGAPLDEPGVETSGF